MLRIFTTLKIIHIRATSHTAHSLILPRRPIRGSFTMHALLYIIDYGWKKTQYIFIPKFVLYLIHERISVGIFMLSLTLYIFLSLYDVDILKIGISKCVFFIHRFCSNLAKESQTDSIIPQTSIHLKFHFQMHINKWLCFISHNRFFFIFFFYFVCLKMLQK